MPRPSPNLPTRGYGLWRQEFYSIYSWSVCQHCPTEAHGTWRNVWVQRASQVVYALAPGLWLWWVARPGSRARREVARLFPGLGGKNNS